MGKSLQTIISDLQDLVDDLERFDDLEDDLINHSNRQIAIDCLQYGLPFIEEKYGHSSSEAEVVRMLIDQLCNE